MFYKGGMLFSIRKKLSRKKISDQHESFYSSILFYLQSIFRSKNLIFSNFSDLCRILSSILLPTIFISPNTNLLHTELSLIYSIYVASMRCFYDFRLILLVLCLYFHLFLERLWLCLLALA